MMGNGNIPSGPGYCKDFVVGWPRYKNCGKFPIL